MLGANAASHASGGGILIAQTGTAILFRTRINGNLAFGTGVFESAGIFASQSKFWLDRRAAHVDCLGKLVLQQCYLTDSSEAMPHPGDASAWIVSRSTASVLLADSTLCGPMMGTRMLNMFDASEVAVRGCRAVNLTVEQDPSASMRLGIVNSTFSPPLDSELRLLGPSDETCSEPISVEAAKAVWNDTDGRLCDPRATCSPGPSGGVQCACRGEVSEGNERGDGSRCLRPLAVAATLATRTVTMTLTKPTLVNESLQVSVQADGEAKFTGTYTGRSVLVRRNGDRADFPSEQVISWSRDSVTVPLDAKAGVFTSRIIREFTVRLECARDAHAQLCPADGDTIETSITFSSTTDASVYDTALLRSEVEATPSCSWTTVRLTPDGGVLPHNAPDLAVMVMLADVDGFPINFTDPDGLQVSWTGPGAPGGTTTVPLTRTEARSNVLRSRVPREYRSVPGRYTLNVSMSGLRAVSDSAPTQCILMSNPRIDVECATGYTVQLSEGCSSYFAPAIIAGVLVPLLLLGIAVLMYYRARHRTAKFDSRWLASHRERCFRQMRRLWDESTGTWKVELMMAAAGNSPAPDRTWSSYWSRSWSSSSLRRASARTLARAMSSWAGSSSSSWTLRPASAGTIARATSLDVDAVDRFGYLPLHYAVSANAPLEMVESLIAAFPLGPSIRDAKKNLALHLAIASGADPTVVRAVYFAFTEAGLAMNSDGQLPVQLLARRVANGHTYDASVIGLAELLAFPVDCEGRCENWFYLLQHEEHDPIEARSRSHSMVGSREALFWRASARLFLPSPSTESIHRERLKTDASKGLKGGWKWRRRKRGLLGTFDHAAMATQAANATSLINDPSLSHEVGPIALMVSAVLDAARSRSVTIEALAYAKDKKGRVAIDVATIENKRRLWRHLLLLGRYVQRRLLHQSNTSCVWEVEDKETEDEGLRVLALKQVACELNFAREISLRLQHRLSDEFVVQLIREHPAERIFVMPHCDCSLEHALCTENFAGISADLVRSTAKQLATALMHLHHMGVVHGDIKPKNVCRFRGAWKLIDLDAASSVGGMAGSKIMIGQMPANMPPELASRVFRANFPANAIRAKLAEESHGDARVVWEECLGVVEELDQAGLDPSVCTLSDAAPSLDMWGLGLILYRLVTAFRLLNSDENDELDESQLRDLVLWRGIDRSELRRKVFAKAEPGTVACSEKDAAVELIAACLHPDPEKRPQTAQELLKLEYFLPRGSGTVRAKLLFVSTPGKCFNRRTGKFDFNLMGWLQKLCRHFAGRFVIAYDWAGSSSADARDKPWFDQIFQVRNSEGRTLFEEWTAAPPSGKEALIDVAEQILNETRWLASYRGSIKAQIRETCQSGAKAILVRFDGGPITRVEARIMAQLVGESTADLAQLGVRDPTIDLRAFDTVYDFADTGMSEVLGEIYGENCEPIPAGLLAELPEPRPNVQWAVGTQVVHPLRGGGRVVKIDMDDPRDRPVHVVFGTGEVHHYSLGSAAAKLEQVEHTRVSEPGPTDSPSVQWAVGTQVVHPLRGGGRVVKIDMDDPRDRPVHVVFDTGEVHHYSLGSAAAKLKQVEHTQAPFTVKLLHDRGTHAHKYVHLP